MKYVTAPQDQAEPEMMIWPSTSVCLNSSIVMKRRKLIRVLSSLEIYFHHDDVIVKLTPMFVKITLIWKWIGFL